MAPAFGRAAPRGPRVEARLARARVTLLVAGTACAPHNLDPACGWQRVVSVAVSPPSIVLGRGDTARVHATFIRPRSGSGCAPRPFGFAWHSSDTTVANIDGSGLVVARDTGVATITVTTGDGPMGTAGVRVHP